MIEFFVSASIPEERVHEVAAHIWHVRFKLWLLETFLREHYDGPPLCPCAMNDLGDALMARYSLLN